MPTLLPDDPHHRTDRHLTDRVGLLERRQHRRPVLARRQRDDPRRRARCAANGRGRSAGWRRQRRGTIRSPPSRARRDLDEDQAGDPVPLPLVGQIPVRRRNHHGTMMPSAADVQPTTAIHVTPTSRASRHGRGRPEVLLDVAVVGLAGPAGEEQGDGEDRQDAAGPDHPDRRRAVVAIARHAERWRDGRRGARPWPRRATARARSTGTRRARAAPAATSRRAGTTAERRPGGGRADPRWPA